MLGLAIRPSAVQASLYLGRWQVIATRCSGEAQEDAAHVPFAVVRSDSANSKSGNAKVQVQPRLHGNHFTRKMSERQQLRPLSMIHNLQQLNAQRVN